MPGFHPIDFQPYCYTFLPRRKIDCAHWKHPIQRFDRDRTFIVSRPGAHRADGGDRNDERREPAEGVVFHHFQYRDEEFTRRKLDLVFGSARLKTTRKTEHFHVRQRSLDAVYQQRWPEIDTDSTTILNEDTLAPWPDLDSVRRWYSRDELTSAIDSFANRTGQVGYPHGCQNRSRRSRLTVVRFHRHLGE